MKGTEKQIKWATEIQQRYNDARLEVVLMAEKLPEENSVKIVSALEKIDSKLLSNDSAWDIIARSGYAYFTDDDKAANVKALKEVVMAIAKGNATALTAD